MSEQTGIFLQVRIASSRLNGKALLPLAGKPVIVHAMEALSTVPADSRWILTDEQSAPELTDPADRCGFKVYAGDPENVLKRYCDAADHAGADTIVRATGDNPLVSSFITEQSLALQRETGADYAGVTGSPLGTGVEILRAQALRDLLVRTTDRYEQEHVGPGLYRRPKTYHIAIREVDRHLYQPAFRVTLDTAEDYQRLQSIFRDLYRGAPIDIGELVAYARKQLQYSA